MYGMLYYWSVVVRAYPAGHEDLIRLRKDRCLFSWTAMTNMYLQASNTRALHRNLSWIGSNAF